MIDPMHKCDECESRLYAGDYICCHGCYADMKKDLEREIGMLKDREAMLRKEIDMLCDEAQTLTNAAMEASE